MPMRWTIRPSQMYFLAQKRHKPKALSVQLAVNKRKYNNDLDPSLGRGVPRTGIRPAGVFRKCRNDASAPLERLNATRAAIIGNLRLWPRPGGQPPGPPEVFEAR